MLILGFKNVSTKFLTINKAEKHLIHPERVRFPSPTLLAIPDILQTSLRLQQIPVPKGFLPFLQNQSFCKVR